MAVCKIIACFVLMNLEHSANSAAAMIFSKPFTFSGTTSVRPVLQSPAQLWYSQDDEKY